MFEGVPSPDEITSDADESLYGVRLPAQTEVAGQIFEKHLALIPLYGITYKVRRHPEMLKVAHIEEWIEQYNEDKDLLVPLDDRHPCWNDLKKQYNAIIRGLENGNKNN